MRKGILAAACAVALMYAAGIACFFFGNIGAGASLWILSTVIGLAFLWYEDRRRKRETAASEEADTGEGAPSPDTARKKNEGGKGI